MLAIAKLPGGSYVLTKYLYRLIARNPPAGVKLPIQAPYTGFCSV